MYQVIYDGNVIYTDDWDGCVEFVATIRENTRYRVSIRLAQ
jgi:hypothetical protein